ncbi:MAG TPA: type VI secretion system tip protein TssI/VgrG [Longimicrobium sp.]|jgi:type VI secretion system secreted protein VgrG
MSYTQANRPIRVETVLGPDVLLLEGVSGVEGVSTPFSFGLDLVSEDDAVAAASLLRTPAVVTLTLSTGEERVFHGLIRRFVQEGRDEELTTYQAEIVPWIWFLSLSRESRIYQNLSVPEILEELFRRLGHADFELRCTRSYPKREYCVQYRETHLEFVSRLMEEEGIFYFFEHTPERHLLVVADDNGAVQPCPVIPAARFLGHEGGDVVGMLHSEEQACTGKVMLRDYDFLQPSLKLESAIAADDPEEDYDYPGDFAAPDDGDRYARIRLEEAAALRQVVRGQSTCRAFQSGFRFELTDHFRPAANQPYMLLQVQHVASAGDYRAWEGAPMEYRNHFLAIPHSVPYRPRRATPHPVIHGSQTALVVGPAGEEVWVDSHGRIKVQFYWDRVGRKDENSSCWVRVAQPWAGKGWGAVQIPRIGNEVVVEFLEGDPDRPLVTGSVYNAEQTPPFDLPGAGIQMGMKSRSSKGGGGYNEITMTDTKGTEQVTIHAQYDMGTTVEHDDTQTVNNDRTITVQGKHTETVTGDTSITVSSGKYSHDVAAGTATYHVAGAVSETFDSTLSTTVASKVTLDSTGSEIAVTAATKISIQVGSSSLTMDAGGNIELSGVNIKINGVTIAVSGDAEASMAVAASSVKCTPASMEVAGAMVKSAATAINEITGATVKLN